MILRRLRYPLVGGLFFFASALFGAGPYQFYPIIPCRFLDTRPNAALASGEVRHYTVTGSPCNIPASAKAVVFNFAVLPTVVGHFAAVPYGANPAATSTINWSAGETAIANGATLLLGPSPHISVMAAVPGGTAHLLIDVTGYFQ